MDVQAMGDFLRRWCFAGEPASARACGDAAVFVLTAGRAPRRYEAELLSMQRPDKGSINALTMMAADHIDISLVSAGIVRIIEVRAPPASRVSRAAIRCRPTGIG